ncbi:MAG: phospholipase D-like domain-containing protein [Candidatus Methanospirareceae archaeon]
MSTKSGWAKAELTQRCRYGISFTLSLTLASLLLFSLPLILSPETIAKSTDNGEQADVIITGIYPNTAMRYELDEYVAITNPGAHSVNIGGWSITDNEGTIIFPPFDLAPDQTVYVTRNASAFVAQMRAVKRESILPDFEYGSDSDPKVSQMEAVEGAFVLRNTGDEVILRDKSGREVDVVIYGDSSYEGEGWQGAPLENPREGMIFVRRGLQDTNRCEDWLILPLGASYHAPNRFSCYGPATAFVSPDCSFSVLERELNSATSSLYINLYQFENPYLMDLVLDALDRGVKVRLLLEAAPVGGFTAEERYIAETVTKNGGEVRLSHDPFINHAKYAVLDNRTVIVTSENWKATGIPTNNSFGNRGWGIVLRDEEVANYFTDVFLEDFYRGEEFALEGEGLERGVMSRAIPHGSYAPVFEPRTTVSNFTVIPVLAPDTAMSNETILGAIQGAEESIFVEQFSTERFWDEEQNTFIAALIEAARRGCEVKVLLDSKDYNVDTWNDNDEVVSWIEEVAREDNLDLEARLADLDSLGLTKLHSKGLIVDGKVAVITSLNWNARSVYNREAGVIVENEEIASFFEDVFFHDWNMSREAEGIATGERGAEREERIKMKLIGVTATLLISFVIFRIVKWYKRV